MEKQQTQPGTVTVEQYKPITAAALLGESEAPGHYRDEALKQIDRIKARRPEVVFTMFQDAAGTEFHTFDFSEHGRPFRTISVLSSISCISGGDLWKFGFVTPAGEITLLFDGQYVAKGRAAAFSLFAKLEIWAKHRAPEGAKIFALKE